MASSDNVEASALKALGNPLRMRLLTFVAERGEASPVEMSRALDVPLSSTRGEPRRRARLPRLPQLRSERE
jgi:DNA-binding transcriptional ArsR family regulator